MKCGCGSRLQPPQHIRQAVAPGAGLKRTRPRARFSGPHLEIALAAVCADAIVKAQALVMNAVAHQSGRGHKLWEHILARVINTRSHAACQGNLFWFVYPVVILATTKEGCDGPLFFAPLPAKTWQAARISITQHSTA